jgi:flagellin FlaB
MYLVQKTDSGFSGLEATIVLIAFVVVAAVFGYIVLGTGMISSQKSGEVIHKGIDQAGSSLNLGGTIVAQADATGGKLGTIEIYLVNSLGNSGIDVDRMMVILSTSDTVSTLRQGDGKMNTVFLINRTADRILKKGDLAKTTLIVSDYSLTPGKKFELSIQPSSGNTLVIERTVPSSLPANKHYELLV